MELLAARTAMTAENVSASLLDILRSEKNEISMEPLVNSAMLAHHAIRRNLQFVAGLAAGAPARAPNARHPVNIALFLRLSARSAEVALPVAIKAASLGA